jgi:hypothetical protein
MWIIPTNLQMDVPLSKNGIRHGNLDFWGINQDNQKWLCD